MSGGRFPLRYRRRDVWVERLTRPAALAALGLAATAAVAGMLAATRDDVAGVDASSVPGSSTTETRVSPVETSLWVVDDELPAPSELAAARTGTLCALTWTPTGEVRVGDDRWVVQVVDDTGAAVTVHNLGYVPVANVTDLADGPVTLRVRLERTSTATVSEWVPVTCPGAGEA